MILLLDNFDSFTYNLLDYLQQLGLTCKVVRNDVSLEEISLLKPSAFVFSPGPGVPSNAGIMPEIIRKYHQQVPMLGICLGHQAIGEFFGAQLVSAARPMHGKISKIRIVEDPLFKRLPETFNVVRYHSLILKKLPEEVISIAQTYQGEVMALKHTKFPCYGVQFHPEAYLTEYGLELLANWANLYHLAG